MAMIREIHRQEFFDGPLTSEQRRAERRDIDRLNRWFGGSALIVSWLRRVARDHRQSGRLVIVDVGGGGPEQALRVVRWARRHRRPVTMIVVDHNADACAAVRAETNRGIGCVRADATALPFRARSVDVVYSALTLHHLDPHQAVQALREMRRISAAVIVADLLRSRWSWLLVFLATRVCARTPMARHDGPLSVRRAYSEDELRGFAVSAGGADVTVKRYPWLARVVSVLT